MINCLQFNDLHTLLSAGDDNVVRVWDIHSNRVIHALMGHKSPIRSFHSDEQFVASGSADGYLRFHDMRMKRTLQVVKATQGGLTSVKFNDNHILTGHANNAITHWDIRYSKWDQEVLYAHKGAVTCLGFDRTKMISGSLDSTVRLGLLLGLPPCGTCSRRARREPRNNPFLSFQTHGFQFSVQGLWHSINTGEVTSA